METGTPSVQAAEPVQHSAKEHELAARREQKWNRVQQVQELHQLGLGIRAISKKAGLSRKTIREYLAWTEVPRTVRSPRTTLLDPHREQVVKLVDQLLTGPTILCIIQEQGYQGSRSTLGQCIAEPRRLRLAGEQPSPRLRHVSPRSAAKVLTKPRDKVDDEDRPYLNRLLSNVEGTVVVRNLAMSFCELMK